MPPQETVPTTTVDFDSLDTRPRIIAQTEYEQYEWLRANLAGLGMNYSVFHRMAYPANRDVFRAWIAERVVFVTKGGCNTMVRVSVVKLLQACASLRDELSKAERDRMRAAREGRGAA